jgi:hypothetical protein
MEEIHGFMGELELVLLWGTQIYEFLEQEPDN